MHCAFVFEKVFPVFFYFLDAWMFQFDGFFFTNFSLFGLVIVFRNSVNLPHYLVYLLVVCGFFELFLQILVSVFVYYFFSGGVFFEEAVEFVVGFAAFYFALALDVLKTKAFVVHAAFFLGAEGLNVLLWVFSFLEVIHQFRIVLGFEDVRAFLEV